MTQNTMDNRTSRRTFLGGTAALAASAVLPHGVFGDDAGKPNSVFNGVRIGCITYSYRGGIEYRRVHARLPAQGRPERDGADGRPHPLLRRHSQWRRARAWSGRWGGRRRPETAPPPAAMPTVPSSARRNWPSAPSSARCTTTPASTSTSTSSPSARPTRTSTSTSRSPRLWAARRITTERNDALAKKPRPVRREAQDLGRVPQPHQQRADDRGPRPARCASANTSASTSTSATTSPAPRANRRSRSSRSTTTRSSACT